MLGYFLLTWVLVLPAGVQARPAVPAGLLQWANSDPMTFVQLLAEAGLPAGLELGESDYKLVKTTRSRWNSQEWNRERFERDATVPADELVTVFNASHPTYRADLQDGVFVIRPRTGRAAYLDTRALSGLLTARGLMAIGEKVFAPMDQRLNQPLGRPGSVLGRPGLEIDHGEQLDFSVNAAGLTVLEVLNEIARTGPGHAWFVVTAGGNVPRLTRFGFVHRYGSTTGMPLK
jgi:hypothetical protein